MLVATNLVNLSVTKPSYKKWELRELPKGSSSRLFPTLLILSHLGTREQFPKSSLLFPYFLDAESIIELACTASTTIHPCSQ
jgi:hypothetical protein